MPTPAQQPDLPILRTAAEGMRLARDHWRFVILVATVGAGFFTALLPFVKLPVTFVLSTVVSAAVYAAFLGVALRGPKETPKALFADTMRLWLAMGLIGAIYFVIAMGFLFFAMAAIAGRYMDEITAAKADETAVQAILTSALQSNPLPAMLLLTAGAIVSLWLSSRFFAAGPATIDAKRIRVFDTWSWTKHAAWRIALARLVLLAPAGVLWGSLHALASAALGLGVASPFELGVVQPAGDPMRLYALAYISQWLQIALLVALEAGLAVHIYRKLKPA